MGWGEVEEEVFRKSQEIDPSTFPIQAQYALLLFNLLPDKIEGMAGTWLGKDYSGLKDIMDLYEIEDKLVVFELLQICIVEASKYYAEKQKREMNKIKNK